jgi:CRISPR system Cascade subunit CasA
MSRFNLIDEPWIPVRTLDGRLIEVGILEALTHANQYAAIEATSPLVVGGLHRFLLAVLYRALEGPTDIDQARTLFRDGLPVEKIAAYLEKWHARFWLFDAERPFMQHPGFQPETWKPWPVLALERNGDNAKVLFDHTDTGNAGAVPLAVAARGMIAVNNFVVGSGNSELAYTSGAPAAGVVVVLPLGASLQDTLVFSLVPQHREIQAADLPVWERGLEPVDVLRKGPTRAMAGYADLYSWPTRTLRLADDESGSVAVLGFASGVKYDAAPGTDPMLGYRLDAKKGRLPLQFKDRGVWRDFDSLLPDSSGLAPKIVEHAALLARRTPERAPRSLLVLGLANDKARLKFWRMERFELPAVLAGDREARVELRQLLDAAETTQKSLWKACNLHASAMLSRGDREPRAEDATAVMAQIPAIHAYWSAMEAAFHEALHHTRLGVAADDIRHRWFGAMRRALGQAWDQHKQSGSALDVWAIRAIVKAERPVLRKLAELREEIQKLEPHEKEAA